MTGKRHGKPGYIPLRSAIFPTCKPLLSPPFFDQNKGRLAQEAYRVNPFLDETIFQQEVTTGKNGPSMMRRKKAVKFLCRLYQGRGLPAGAFGRGPPTPAGSPATHTRTDTPRTHPGHHDRDHDARTNPRRFWKAFECIEDRDAQTAPARIRSEVERREKGGELFPPSCAEGGGIASGKPLRVEEPRTDHGKERNARTNPRRFWTRLEAEG